jgi:hypothetical protein
MWDVIEHMSDPLAVCGRVHQLLRPGGILACSTHLVDSTAARLLGTRYPFFMDMHVVHFSRATLGELLRRSGFELTRLGSHRRILALGYLLDKLAHLIPVAPMAAPIGWLASRPRVARRFVPIGGLGLVNAFARRNTPGDLTLTPAGAHRRVSDSG